jgi:hypothetical protein
MLVHFKAGRNCGEAHPRGQPPGSLPYSERPLPPIGLGDVQHPTHRFRSVRSSLQSKCVRCGSRRGKQGIPRAGASEAAKCSAESLKRLKRKDCGSSHARRIVSDPNLLSRAGRESSPPVTIHANLAVAPPPRSGIHSPVVHANP